ncbi:hypothetical protein FIBSPDRAFT_924148 [Athelia psychrophila]|uniref:GST N-terminal domain-containing protein n=1 Tax=Athelia psychrophila TaxID=1759441 RepID=A0A166XF95_9AGAM|nr:hypothetical protein FIBSPDRAFT_924148 [Fibularhizoctonia sp. CBS 109695]
MTITLYDIPSKISINAWSPNTWKARLALNIKGLPYQTVWVECPDIERLYKEIGAKPSDIKESGVPRYTLPLIHDHATNAVISDSANIAQYLDDQYPDTTPLFPKGSRALQAAFEAAHERVALTHLYPLMGLTVVRQLNPPSEDYCRITKRPKSGVTLEEVELKGEARDEQWKKVREGHERIADWFSKNEEGSFVMGKDISFADLVLASFLGWARITFGQESGEWKTVLMWQDGWWARYLEQFDQHQAQRLPASKEYQRQAKTATWRDCVDKEGLRILNLEESSSKEQVMVVEFKLCHRGNIEWKRQFVAQIALYSNSHGRVLSPNS